MPNYYEWETPVFTWTEKLLNGNLRGIQRANEKNLQEFTRFGGKVDIIHAQVCHKAGLIARWLSKKYKIPYVITEQMSPFPFPQILKNGRLSSRYAQAYQAASTNIAISPDLRDKMKKLGIPRVEVVPNLTDELFFLPASKNQDGSFTFFTLCDMREQKDLPTLFKAIARLLEKNPSVRFRIGGGGEMFVTWKNLADNMGLSPFVTWLGPLDRQQAQLEFRQAHAFVLPSIQETLGVVFLEAIACGIPVIGTRCGGPESIINDENGILVEVGNPIALCDAMEALIDNYLIYDAGEIRTSFLERFSITPVCNQLEGIYKNVISAKNTAGT